MFDELFAFDHVEDCSGDGHADRVAAEGAAVCAGDEQPGNLGLGIHHPDGQSTPDGFAEGHDIRLNSAGAALAGSRRAVRFSGVRAKVLMRKPFSGSSTAGPYFIEDQCQSALIAQFPYALGVVGGIEIDAPFTLNRLHEDTGGLIIHRLLERIKVARRNMDESGDFRPETDAIGGVAGGRDHGERTAVEALDQRKNLPLFTTVL